jgi:hypothetical protein
MAKVFPIICKCLVLVIVLCSTSHARSLDLTDEELSAIANRVFMNECGGKTECLTSWNAGEQFASLGIGHFIWYPAGVEGPFHESFPELLGFIESKGIVLPLWLKQNPDCPWNTREEFLQNKKSKDMVELRIFLINTIPLQSLFISDRLEKALPKMTEGLPEKTQSHVCKQFNRVADSPMGMYALIDYVNFKGEGVSLTERYNGHGWGLLQVLQEMKGKKKGKKALKEFSRAAELVLTRRVENAPKERHEEKWLPGWKKRVHTYAQEME